jgi:hypothetical protein
MNILYRIAVVGIIACAVFAVTGSIVHAASPTAGTLWSGGYWGPLISCTGDYAGLVKNSSITAKCTSFCDLLVTGQNILYFGMTLAIYILVPVFFIWGGFLILISRGSTNLLGKGKQVLTGTVVGLLIILGAFVIINTFLWLLGNPIQSGQTGANGAARPYVGWGTITCTPPTDSSQSGSAGAAVTPASSSTGSQQIPAGCTDITNDGIINVQDCDGLINKDCSVCNGG